MIYRVTKDTIIGDVLDHDKDTALIFLEIGMQCLNCPMSRGETIEEACKVHEVNYETVVANINKHFKDKEKQRQ